MWPRFQSLRASGVCHSTAFLIRHTLSMTAFTTRHAIFVHTLAKNPLPALSPPVKSVSLALMNSHDIQGYMVQTIKMTRQHTRQTHEQQHWPTTKKPLGRSQRVGRRVAAALACPTASMTRALTLDLMRMKKFLNRRNGA